MLFIVVQFLLSFTHFSQQHALHYFSEENPYPDVSDPSEAHRWPNGGNGLQLTIYNTLDDDWHVYFDQAIQDWDNGTPDSLTLSTKSVTPNSNCSPVDGVMKVCNGDYGDSGWKGINEVSFLGKTILASVVKMNEHYLQKYKPIFHDKFF